MMVTNILPANHLSGAVAGSTPGFIEKVQVVLGRRSCAALFWGR